MITMLLAGTVFHQILVVELPAEGKVSLQPAQARHRLLNEGEARALADSLAGAGATLLSAPSLVAADDEGAEMRVTSDGATFALTVKEHRGMTSLSLRLTEGRRVVADVDARLVIPDGSTFTIPIDAHHLVIGRLDALADGESVEDAAASFQKSWATFLAD